MRRGQVLEVDGEKAVVQVYTSAAALLLLASNIDI